MSRFGQLQNFIKLGMIAAVFVSWKSATVPPSGRDDTGNEITTDK
jgi:hypothetical protein